jgi:hypothetical protein
MRHGQGLQIEPLGRPAALKVNHLPTIAAGQRLTGRPGRRHVRASPVQDCDACLYGGCMPR